MDSILPFNIGLGDWFLIGEGSFMVVRLYIEFIQNYINLVKTELR